MNFVSAIRRPFLYATCWLLCSAGVVYGQSSYTIEQIAKSWKARQERVRSARFKWTETKFFLAHTLLYLPEGGIRKGSPLVKLPEEDLTIERSVAISFSESMMRYSYEGPTWVPQVGKALHRRYVSVFDGELSKNFHGGDGKGGELYHPSGFIRGKKLHYDYDNGTLTAILITYRGCQPDMGGVDIAGYRLSSKRGMIGERTCLILEPPRSARSQKCFWVHPQREFVVLRVEQRDKRGGVLSTLDITYVEHPPDGFVPSGWKYVDTGGSGNIVFRQTEAKVSECEINCDIAKSEFQFDFPPGTRVTDHRSRQSYVIREDGTERMITKGEKTRGATYREYLETETGQAGLKPSGFPWWTSAAVAGALVLVVALCIYRWRNS